MVEHLDFIKRPTTQLKTMVAHHQKNLSPEQFAEMMSEIKRVYLKLSGILADFPPGPERALVAQKIMSNQIAATTDVKATCQKGCGACCHLEVEITRDEGEVLARCVTAGQKIDLDRLQKQAARKRRGVEWSLYDVRENRCVFLGDDQACQVYEYRPLICRKHLVQSDPKECRIDGRPDPILIPLAEILMSAAMSQPDNPTASLSKSLLSALEELGHPLTREASQDGDTDFSDPETLLPPGIRPSAFREPEKQ